MKPYVDVSISEKGIPEYSVHNLNKEQVDCILAALKITSDIGDKSILLYGRLTISLVALNP